MTHAPAVFSAGTVNADFSLRVDGRLERGASLIATDLLCTSGGHIPANAPHFFRNTADRAARLLCTCAPSGLEEFFLAVGDRVSARTSPPPDLDDDALAARMAKAVDLAPRYRMELLLER